MNTASPVLRSSPDLPDGKRRLIQAALRISAGGQSLTGIGLRELARAAELNPNTFYRHFSDMEELAQYAAREVAHEVMDGMQKVRDASSHHADATEGAAEYLLQEVARNPDAYRMGLRELHGGSPAMRRILHNVLDEIAQLSVQQIQAQNLVPGLAQAALYEASLNISYYMFCRAVDFLDAPDRAEVIRRDIVRYIRIQFMGALALQQASA